MKRFFLAVAARFRNFFTADISGDAERLAWPDMRRIADLVTVCPVKERPQCLVIVYFRLPCNLRESFAAHYRMVSRQRLLSAMPGFFGFFRVFGGFSRSGLLLEQPVLFLKQCLLPLTFALISFRLQPGEIGQALLFRSEIRFQQLPFGPGQIKIIVRFFRFVFQHQGFPHEESLFDAFGFFGQKPVGPIGPGAVKNRSGFLTPNS